MIRQQLPPPNHHNGLSGGLSPVHNISPHQILHPSVDSRALVEHTTRAVDMCQCAAFGRGEAKQLLRLGGVGALVKNGSTAAYVRFTIQVHKEREHAARAVAVVDRVVDMHPKTVAPLVLVKAKIRREPDRLRAVHIAREKTIASRPHLGSHVRRVNRDAPVAPPRGVPRFSLVREHKPGGLRGADDRFALFGCEQSRDFKDVVIPYERRLLPASTITAARGR